jgi:hypothetical protein
MMRARLLPLIAVLALAAAIPVAAVQGKEKQARVTDKSGALSVVVPSGWTPSDADIMGAKLFLLGPEYKGFRININLATESVGSMSLAEYTRATEANAPRIINQYERVSRKSAKLGGLPATELVYRGAFGTPPTKFQFKAVFAIKDQTAYIFTFTAPPAVFDQHVKAADAVTSSVKWKQRKDS